MRIRRIHVAGALAPVWNRASKVAWACRLKLRRADHVQYPVELERRFERGVTSNLGHDSPQAGRWIWGLSAVCASRIAALRGVGRFPACARWRGRRPRPSGRILGLPWPACRYLLAEPMAISASVIAAPIAMRAAIDPSQHHARAILLPESGTSRMILPQRMREKMVQGSNVACTPERTEY